MVGAQLKGFDTMVQLTEYNDFMLIEGDEYLSSPIDLRPKFLWYQPNVTLISNCMGPYQCFPHKKITKNNSAHIETIVPGGALYNQEDAVLTRLVAQTQNTIRTRENFESFIENGIIFGNTRG